MCGVVVCVEDEQEEEEERRRRACVSSSLFLLLLIALYHSHRMMLYVTFHNAAIGMHKKFTPFTPLHCPSTNKPYSAATTSTSKNPRQIHAELETAAQQLENHSVVRAP